MSYLGRSAYIHRSEILLVACKSGFARTKLRMSLELQRYYDYLFYKHGSAIAWVSSGVCVASAGCFYLANHARAGPDMGEYVSLGVPSGTAAGAAPALGRHERCHAPSAAVAICSGPADEAAADVRICPRRRPRPRGRGTPRHRSTDLPGTTLRRTGGVAGACERSRCARNRNAPRGKWFAFDRRHRSEVRGGLGRARRRHHGPRCRRLATGPCRRPGRRRGAMPR